MRLLAAAVLTLCFAAPAQAGQGLVPATLEWGPEVHSLDEDLSIEERRKIQQQLKLRRTMMDVHQVFAFVTAGSIVATEVVGIINDIALDTGSPKRSEIEGSLIAHRVLAGFSTGTYLTAGILAWTAPPALRLHEQQLPKGKVDSGELHVAFSVVHGIAMATVMATGILQANVTPAGQGWDALIVAHKVAGFTAAGFVVMAGVTIGTL